MSVPKETRSWILNEQPTDKITENTFKLETQPLKSESELKDGELIVKVLALSNDPAQRGWMDGSIDPRRMYVPIIQPGESIRAGILGEVVASKSKWKVGQKVIGGGTWSEYCVLQDSPMLREAFNIEGHSEYISMSGAGMTGQTAYVGVFEEMKLEKDHVVVVSGAAGAVGSIVVQIAKKVVGCKKVIGIAGGKEKCEWVKSIGADECIDYKDKNYPSKLKAALPDYADRYFDNVGGEILDHMLALVKRYGFISACGAISGYNDKAISLNEWNQIIYNRLTVKGFIVFDHLDKLPKAVEDLKKWIEDGTISHTEAETVVKSGFEGIPDVWQKLFEGGNKGKLITQLQ